MTTRNKCATCSKEIHGAEYLKGKSAYLEDKGVWQCEFCYLNDTPTPKKPQNRLGHVKRY